MIDELEDKFLEARKITGGYGSGPDILHSCDISVGKGEIAVICLLYTSPSPRDGLLSRMPSSA